MIVKEFNNNNIHIKFTPDAITDIANNRISDIEAISFGLEMSDTGFIGEEFCLSNFDCGATLYNAYSDKCYILAFSDIARKLLAGKTLILYAHTPDDEEREELERW